MKSSRLAGALFLLVLGIEHLAWAEDDRPLRALTLDQALAELIQVRSRVADARALATQARVPLVPTVVAAGGYTRNSADAVVDFTGTPLASIHPGALVIQPLGVWTVAGTVRVPLVIPNAWADWAAAQRAADAVAATAESARLQLRASLAQAAWAAAAAEEIVDVSERAVTVADEHRRSAARGVTAGTEAPLSVLKAETEVVKRQSDLAQARANCERSHLALGVLLGKSEPLRVLLPPGSWRAWWPKPCRPGPSLRPRKLRFVPPRRRRTRRACAGCRRSPAVARSSLQTCPIRRERNRAGA
jgi:outer membrane protein TolC